MAEKNTVVAVILGEGPEADAAEALARQVAQNPFAAPVRVVRGAGVDLPRSAQPAPAGPGSARVVILDFQRKVAVTLDDKAATRVSDLSEAFLQALAGSSP